MSAHEMPLFSMPSDVPPAFEYASGLLHTLVKRAAQCEQHQNPHKTLHLTARCIEIFEGLVEAIRTPPTFEDAVEALGSLRELEFLVVDAVAVLENEVASPTSNPPGPGYVPGEQVVGPVQRTWVSLRNALLGLLTKAYDTDFKPPTNWGERVEEVKRVDDHLWASMVAESMRNKHSDPQGVEQVESVARELLGDLDEDIREEKLETTSRLFSQHWESPRQPNQSSPPWRSSGSLPSVNLSNSDSMQGIEMANSRSEDVDAVESQPPVTFQLADEQGNSIVVEEGRQDHGGFSDIYMGHWTSPWTGKPETVAIKIHLRPLLRADPPDAGPTKHHMQEVFIWQKLKGPRITPLLGYTSTITGLGGPAIISPWRKSGELGGYVKMHPQADKLTLLIQAAEAVNVLHTLKPNPIVHGDVKPRNFLINDDGEVELFDFDISYELENVSSGDIPDEMYGAVRYLAPETLLGEARSTSRDVYAFGGSMLEVLTGIPPFVHLSTDVGIILAIVQGETPKRSEHQFSYSPDIVDELWKLMSNCWSLGPTDRPTMAGVIERLNQIRIMVGDDPLTDQAGVDVILGKSEVDDSRKP